ncbi:hypothetical protein VCRA2119O48_110118 [Vibrio crassostreae]|nr:hypothetical protein VCRA2119O48_110118 [Vibrio crassostreae]
MVRLTTEQIDSLKSNLDSTFYWFQEGTVLNFLAIAKLKSML